MSFLKLQIRKVIKGIQDNNYFLPSIQREFVWERDQIEQLFDSMMRGYPIGSFLFWKVTPETAKKFKFYQFLHSYHARDSRHNEPARITGENDITAILDGQQRLTSLLIGLTGTYADKVQGKWATNNNAYPQRVLCLEALSPCIDSDIEQKFNFKFLKQDEIVQNEKECWLPLPQFFSEVKEVAKTHEFIFAHPVLKNSPSPYALSTLHKLAEVLNHAELINYYQEEEQTLDRVLNIFIRVNSGGTKLSYSDLLLSIATAMWKHVDAREAVINFVDEISRIGDGFDFTKDFVLKAALILADIKDIKFSVDNFNQANMNIIEGHWDEITKAVRMAVQLVADFGFNQKRLSSINSIIPIAYYLKRIKAQDNYLTSSQYRQDRERIKKWLILVLLRGVFGSMADTIQAATRTALDEADLSTGFPVKALNDKLLKLNRAVTFSGDEIETLGELGYGDQRTFLVLSLLYPQLNYRNRFHIDHIFPRSKLVPSTLKRLGIEAGLANQISEARDNIGNLQIIEGHENQAKRDKDISDWLSQEYPDSQRKGHFLHTHFIPHDASLTYADFMTFVGARKEEIVKKLKQELLETSEAEQSRKIA